MEHFQHIIGLAEEAQMLATTKCNKYPLLSESVIIYNDLLSDNRCIVVKSSLGSGKTTALIKFINSLHLQIFFVYIILFLKILNL